MRPDASRASSSWSFSAPIGGARPLPLLLELLDLGAELEHLRRQGLLLVLEIERGLDERRALLGGVTNAGPLGGELGRDEEPEPEQRETERDLPARDRSQPAADPAPEPRSWHLGQACAGRRRSAMASTRRPPRTITARSSARRTGRSPARRVIDRARWRGGGRCARTRIRGADRRSGQRRGSALAPPLEVCGPAGAGCGPKRSGGVAPMSCIQAAPNSSTSTPSASSERLVVGAALAVRADQLHERVPAVGPDEVVDR
jgi:hypothetical protein